MTHALADTTQLIFGLHFHQPYGNLDEVFADAMQRCYLPTLALLAEHPHVKTAIHVSGPLLDWAEQHNRELLERLGALVASGQAELLGGGYQEPMLAILPDRDALGQLRRMADRCEQLLSARPTGMWLAERVWEPDLARVIAQSGYRYTLLDDSHLRAAGAPGPLAGYYVTDKAGDAVAVLPIDRGLRTRIPYAEVDELMDYLGSQQGRALTYGDDAEKFGLWPTTERRVWQQGWLARFFEALKSSERVTTVLPTELMATTPSGGPVYIPTISYAEMGAWSLPPAGSLRYQEMAKRLSFAGYEREAASFLRGGIWQGFIAKYPESRFIYRKMLRVSAAVERAREQGHPQAEEARDLLYQGQCNCAYWHGLFGGLYMQHLRAALYHALIAAEALVGDAQKVTLARVDHLGDREEELLFETPTLNLYVAPGRGGSAFELDLIAARFCLTNVIGRRREAYHVDVPRAQVVSDEELENISAHDLVRATEPNLAEKLLFDAYPRGAFIDHVLPADATPEMLDRDYAPLADFANANYQVMGTGSIAGASVATLRAEVGEYVLVKRIEVGPTAIKVSVTLRAEGAARPLCLCSQIDVTLLSPELVGGRQIVVDAPGEHDAMPGAKANADNVVGVRVGADSMGVDVALRCEPAATLWRRPIETVSQSERGFERAYQGTSLVFSWRGEVGNGEALKAQLALRVDESK